MSATIKVRHNVEMAHRLFETPGKCENIHGHSWWVELEICEWSEGVDEHGLFAGLDFGVVKQSLRAFLDANYDHRVLLNSEDHWSHVLYVNSPRGSRLPGLQTMNGDPTTENFAKLVGEWAQRTFGVEHRYVVTVWETSVNAATWSG